MRSGPSTRTSQWVARAGRRSPSTTPDAVRPAWDEALAAQAPVVLDMRTDPEVPPISPQIAKNKAAELLPRAGLHSKIDG